MSYTTYRFEVVRQTDKANVTCPDCKKSWTKTIERTYARNGFHNEATTREEHVKELAAEKSKLEASGLVCRSCQDARDDLPITKKVSKDEYAVYDRREPSARIGTVKKRWKNWVAVGVTWEYAVLKNGKPAKEHQEYEESTIKDAADRVLAKHRGLERHELYAERRKAKEAK